jgi:diphosphomevalonate decarboxylase
MNKVGWRSPSNIALVKYWGKYSNQLPANPSISFTLSTSVTETYLSWEEAQGEGGEIQVFLDDVLAPDFEPKIKQFYKRIAHAAPFYHDFNFTIRTHNSFPHSSGIASSASGMSALALCTLSMAQKIGAEFNNFYKEASILSRLGSGSASRSVYGPMAVWGKHDQVAGSSDKFAVPYTDIHPLFTSYQDYILLVDKGEKSVSSTAGHDLMNGHPYAKTRFEHAHKNLDEILVYLRTGDVEKFGELAESEALTLHAMMMTSRPYFILFKPKTLEIINAIWAFRKETKLPVHFTLDAGANVHMLFPEAIKQNVDDFVKSALVGYCAQGEYLCDQVGNGPIQLL